jgi:pyridoxamine 5'-phosphate oxidase
MGLANLRKDYTLADLLESEVDPDPIVQFERWFAEAREAAGHEPNAMSVATVSPDGQPSVRSVLLKALDPQGFVFYTNYDSQKGRDLEANPRVELLFYWPEVERQVRVNGWASRVSREESVAYFASRPRGNQIGALVSPQSQVIASREELQARYDRLERELEGQELLPPEHWGGYRVRPETIEFWQGRRGRLHDRLRYRRAADESWILERLAP